MEEVLLFEKNKIELGACVETRRGLNGEGLRRRESFSDRAQLKE